MLFPRKIEAEMSKFLKGQEALIITGMRQVGKTSLLKRFYEKLPENKVWFDFENPLDIKYFEALDYNDIYVNIVRRGNLDEKKRIYVFIDEAQNYPAVSRIVKYLIDHYELKFFLTGSASYYLKNLFPESLAGRKVIFELYPLDFEEFLIFKDKEANLYKNIKAKDSITELEYELYNKDYEEFIEWGGFPKVVLTTDWEKKKAALQDIFSSYYQKEILNLADYGKNNKIRDLIILLAARVGSRLDLVKLSQELQTTRKTIYDYLTFLQATYFIHLVSPFSQSVDREVSGMQKVYFCDNGILQIMQKLNEGQLLENAVYNQLKHDKKINYWKNASSQKEIDFIIDKKTAYEVKNTATPSDLKDLSKTLSSKKIKLEKGFVISKNYVSGLNNVIFGQFL